MSGTERPVGASGSWWRVSVVVLSPWVVALVTAAMVAVAVPGVSM